MTVNDGHSPCAPAADLAPDQTRPNAGSVRCSQRRCEVGHNWCRRSRTDGVAGTDAV